jgi:hypothetical protein
MNTPVLTLSRRLAAVALMATSTCVFAVEGGAPIVPFGVLDFGAGIMPPPAPIATVGLRTAFFRASESRDGAGRASDLSLRVNSYALAAVKTTDTPLFGGRYGYSAVLPVLDMDLDVAVPTPAGTLKLHGEKRGFGDIQVTPLIVQWATPGLFTTASLALQLPTGRYDKHRAVNPGVNHWTASPAFAFTYLHASGFEISSNLQLNIHGRNRDTDYRSGMEFQHEFALGQHAGPFTLGLGGYMTRQLNDDDAPGLASGNRSRVNALGPALSYLNPASGWPALWLHAYREFGARNRAQGHQVALRAALSF